MFGDGEKILTIVYQRKLFFFDQKKKIQKSLSILETNPKICFHLKSEDEDDVED